ncbi:S-adenosyl-L-methionine-dependent methyltransferase [Haematococcus lacustris]
MSNMFDFPVLDNDSFSGGFFSAPPPPWLSAFTTPILQPPAPPQARSPPACQDTCFKARDGVCDEVRWLASSAAASLEALCDLGTDCQDCGPWGGHLVDPSWLEWEGAHPVRPSPPGGALGYSSAPGSPAPGPVAFARHQGASVRIKRSSTQPSFLQPITSAAADPDVSAMLEGYGAREGGITRAVAEALSGHCYDPRHGSGRRLVLEVGAAQGYYALYAARLGCRVIAWEPVPLYRAFLALGVALNNLSHLVRGAAVSDLPSGSLVRLGVPRNGTYWALASVEDLNLHPHEVDHSIRVRTERIDDVVAAHEAVLLLKVDVEGYEPQVLSSASALLASPHLSHVLLEYSPGAPPDP